MPEIVPPIAISGKVVRCTKCGHLAHGRYLRTGPAPVTWTHAIGHPKSCDCPGAVIRKEAT